MPATHAPLTPTTSNNNNNNNNLTRTVIYVSHAIDDMGEGGGQSTSTAPTSTSMIELS